MSNMEYKTNKDKKPEDVEPIEQFGLRRDPVFFSDIEAVDYASRINPEIELDSHRNICLRKATEMIPSNLVGETALDIGCGEGRWSRFLAQRGAKVIGIDESSAMIDIAMKRSDKNLGITFKPLGFRELLTLGQSFDIAIASYVFNNITDLDKIFHISKEIVNEDGEIIIVTKTFEVGSNNTSIEQFRGLFLPILVNKRYTMYVAANSFNDYNTVAQEKKFKLVDHFSQISPDQIENRALLEMGLQIEDHVFKYMRARGK